MGNTKSSCTLQVLQALPSQDFSVDVDSAHQLVTCTASALALPAPIKTKWLQTDCAKVLDLTSPGRGWTDEKWQSLVGCLQAVPNLECLAVTLPSAQGSLRSHQFSPSRPFFEPNMAIPGHACQNCLSRGYRYGHSGTVTRWNGVTRRKLKTLGKAEEHKKQETPTIEPIGPTDKRWNVSCRLSCNTCGYESVITLLKHMLMNESVTAAFDVVIIQRRVNPRDIPILLRSFTGYVLSAAAVVDSCFA